MGVESRNGAEFPLGIRQRIDRNADIIVSLPKPPETFERQELSDVQKQALYSLFAHDLVEVATTKRERGSERHVYRVKSDIYREAAEVMEYRETLPCGHTGVSNVRDGGFACSTCGEPVSRDIAERVIFRGSH